MTFCLGMSVVNGLVGIADTRITSGNEVITARKIKTYALANGQLFIMTSGLRSVRDKMLTYFEEDVEAEVLDECDRLYRVVNGLAGSIRKVAAEDKAALRESGLDFDIHALVGGRMSADKGHKLYLVYPEGNSMEVLPSEWIENVASKLERVDRR